MATANPALPNPLNLPQPDFDRLKQGVQQTADELGKLRNLPAFAQGQAILDAITQLNTQMTQLNTQTTQNHNNLRAQFTQLNTRVTQLNTQVTQLNTRVTQLNTLVIQNHNGVTQQITQLDQDMRQGFANLQTGLAAVENNSVARVANSHVNRSNIALMPLRDLTTDAPIPGFPGTMAQINAIQGAGIDNVLTTLNLPTNGTVPQRRQRLRVYIGLVED